MLFFLVHFNRDICLTNNPLFKNRIQFIKFSREEYNHQYRSASNSIVISTFERPECFRKVFQRIITYRPPQTEIIICDDASQSKEKITTFKRNCRQLFNAEWLCYHSYAKFWLISYKT